MNIETAKVIDPKVLEEKILHILSIYPIVSPTMLQGALGPSVKSAVWRPALSRLIEAGKVIEETESLQTPTERYNTYTKLYIAGVTVDMGIKDE